MIKDDCHYEIALSYAHKDEQIASLLGAELENVFADHFFKDTLHPEQLASAAVFAEKLEHIFSESSYAVILYSENYSAGKFTPVELKAILNKNKSSDSPRFFIINLDDTSTALQSIDGLTYIPLKTNEGNIEQQIREIVHKRIKRYMLKKSLEDRSFEYRMSIHTLFAGGNSPLWNPNCDWTTLTPQFLRPQSRLLKDGCTWDELWEYVRNDFDMVKNELKMLRDCRLSLCLNCHLSIAYKLGHLYGDLDMNTPRSLVLTSGKALVTDGFDFSNKHDSSASAPEFTITVSDTNCPESTEIACAISITARPVSGIRDCVSTSLTDAGIHYKKLFLIECNKSISSTDELELTANKLHQQLLDLRQKEGANTVHLFLRTPAALAFVLGGKSIFPGQVRLYEYDTGKDRYFPSLDRGES